MRILHTSDWHLGRTFESISLEEDQRAFVTWLCGVVTERAVDVVVVAGDVWDRANPKAEAVTLMEESLNAVAATGATVIAIAGNHDSAARLAYGASWAKNYGIILVTEDVGYPTPVIVDRNGASVGFVAVPYRDPQRTIAPVPAEDGTSRLRTHTAVLDDALNDGRRQLADADVVATIAVAHAYVSGSATSDSERRYVGGADQVPLSLFHGFDAVLLGHLHRYQEFDEGRVAYCGSPLPYSFSETADKAVRILEVGAEGLTSIERVEIPVGVAFGRGVSTITGTLEELLTDARYAGAEQHFVAARLTNDTLQIDAKAKLEVRFPHIVNVTRAASAAPHGVAPAVPSAALIEEDPLTVIATFLDQVHGQPPSEEERELLAGVIDAVLQGDAK